MKRTNLLILSALLAVALTLGSCGSNGKKVAEETKTTAVEQVNQFETLITYIENSGDLINNKIVPTMIEPKEVYENLGSYYILDVRNASDFAKGHIEGAKNIKMADLITHFEDEIDPTSFSKIVMVCYTGQASGFSTAILRMLGYDNVYDMKWGMSSWDESFAATKWLKNASNKYADQLEMTPNAKSPANGYPEVMTTKTDGYAILRERGIKLLNDGFEKYRVKVDEVFAPDNGFYLVNYWPEDIYNLGHIPGAIQYQPKKSLGRGTFLSTLPTNQTIVPFCFTGQHSAFVTAYLNIIGYDAKSLLYGANSFMNGEMKARDAKTYHAFSKKKIHGYDFVKDEEALSQPAVVEAAEGGC